MWSYNYTYPNYLAHYGVLGMKWGVRKKSYSQAESNYRSAKKAKKQASKAYYKSYNRASNHLGGLGNFAPSNTKIGKENTRLWNDAVSKAEASNKADAAYKKAKSEYKNSTEYKTKRNNTLKTAAKVGAAVLGTALAAYGGYKAATLVSSKASSVAAGKRIMATYQKGRDVKSSLKSMERYYLRAEGRAASEEAMVRKTMNKADWLQNNSQKKATINKLTNAQVAAGRKADKYYHYRAR